MTNAKVKFRLVSPFTNVKMYVSDVCVEVTDKGYETSNVHEIQALDGNSMVERVGGGKTASSATLEEDS